ncbi:MAG: hypothetical protein HS101_15020 [Planctomycetia bacterium]|jgi:hypothetical protein|nr:hypothetical protein [Planctomycetia bacterium]MCC7316065.1 hypothetical protein [Planctomycetota bacterium]
MPGSILTCVASLLLGQSDPGAVVVVSGDMGRVTVPLPAGTPYTLDYDYGEFNGWFDPWRWVLAGNGGTLYFARNRGEFSARSLLESQGEIIVLTQFKRGAANRGFDFLSAARSPNGLEVFLNEVKNSTGLQFPSGLTALGLNRAGTFDANLARAQAAVAEQVTDNALRTGILGALRQQNYSIRIIGRPGIRITPRTESLIQKTAGTTREVIILEALP